MTTTTGIKVSPFDCRWIVPSSKHQVGDWSFAVCVRVLGVERLVNEADCSRCPRWDGPDEPGACVRLPQQ